MTTLDVLTNTRKVINPVASPGTTELYDTVVCRSRGSHDGYEIPGLPGCSGAK